MFLRLIYFKILHMKISLKLTLSYLAAAAGCMLILSLFYYVNTKNYIDTQTKDFLIQTLKQAKDSIEYKVDLYNMLADSLYLNTNLQDVLFEDYPNAADKPEVQREVLAYIRPLKISYKDLEKVSLIVSNSTIPPYGDEIIEESKARIEDWYRKTIAQDKKVLWLKSSDFNTSNNIVLTRKLDHLIFDSFLGVLKIELNKEYFFKTLNEMDRSGNGWFDIVDIDNNSVYSGIEASNSKFKASAYKEYKEKLFQTLANSAYINIDNQRFMTVQEEIQYTGWKILYTTPFTGYTNAINNLKLAAVGILLISALLFIGISWFLASKFTRKIRELNYSMEKVQTGQFDVFISYPGNDEIGHLISGFNIMARKLKELVEEVYAIKIKKKESELQALQAQINPHFLYNTLASISMLGMRIGGEDITRMSNSLARFYKVSLSNGKTIIRVKDELEHVKAYMDIQNIRFKNKINVVYEIDESILDSRSLKLMLQPFVENAIGHGMSKNKKTINIRVVILKEGDKILWKVIDDGVGISKKSLQDLLSNDETREHGYGIVNVDQRIKLFFGDNYGVSIFSNVGIGTAVTIITPLNVEIHDKLL